MTRLTFECASFADIVKKAASCAPTSGAALDVAPGILITYDRDIDSEDVTIRATNLDLYYTEWTDPLTIEGDPCKWLLSANLLNSVAGALPIGSNKQVSLSDNGQFLMLESGSIKCKLPLISRADEYPDWGVFDPSIVMGTNNFADQINKVSWACALGAMIPLNGIHFTGDYAVATDSFKLAIVPCKVDCDEPFTVPNTVLTQLIKANGGEDAKVAFYNKRLLVMPTPHVQIQVITYDTPYRPWQRAARRDHTDSFKVGKANLLELIQRVNSLIAKDRQPKIDVLIGKQQLVMTSADPGEAKLQDILDIPGFASHDRSLYSFNPGNLSGAIQNAPGNEVKVSYFAARERGKHPNWRIEGDSGFEAWVMPRQPGQKEA